MKPQAGFTLVEAMIALVVLAIGLTGVLGFSTQAIRQSQDNARWTHARLIAESELNQRSANTIDQLEVLVGGSEQSGTTTVYQNYTDYTVNFWYEQLDSQRYRITIRVTYPHAAFDAVTLTTEKNSYL